MSSKSDNVWRLDDAKRKLDYEVQTRDVSRELEVENDYAKYAYRCYLVELDEPAKIDGKKPSLEEGLRVAEDRLQSLKENWGVDGSHYDEVEAESELVESLEEFVERYRYIMQQLDD